MFSAVFPIHWGIGITIFNSTHAMHSIFPVFTSLKTKKNTIPFGIDIDEIGKGLLQSI